MPFATKDTGLNYDPQADQIQAGATRIPQIGRNGDSLRFQANVDSSCRESDRDIQDLLANCASQQGIELEASGVRH